MCVVCVTCVDVCVVCFPGLCALMNVGVSGISATPIPPELDEVFVEVLSSSEDRLV